MKKRYKGEILGTLRIQANWCTESIKIHPIGSGSWCLCPEDINDEQERIRFTSLIKFDGRQTWEVYYFGFADGCGWVVQRNGLYLRMPVRDFEYFFGKYEVIKGEK